MRSLFHSEGSDELGPTVDPKIDISMQEYTSAYDVYYPPTGLLYSWYPMQKIAG